MPVAVVTGAGSGLGRAIAHGLAGAGFTVALLGRRADALEETAESIADALVLPTDVTVPSSVDTAFAAVVDAWGRVDVLVNNAGTFGPKGEVDEIAVDDWLDTVSVNLTGAFLCARAAFGQMKRQDPRGGRIINNGSISAHTPRPGSAAYTSTKHAMTGLTKALALDGRAHDIAVGQIDIGNAATEMTSGFGQTEPTFDPRHVADAVVAMARLPLGVSVPAMTILATGMPYAGRG
ncbi:MULTISPECIES: SDR family oxidoreductase [unclassified Nocardioides]|uniref:SDR family oxidoreductase n=1 Tax=unclassified Nocardioides TaxID=2615069 RepID=UPI0006FD7520|nr:MULTISPECIES: SDR family oxidoreductase [unclassified Nocardioides]KQY63624.1 3-oxoacyl-ACP reductase [Nocardioides sp. Root140]KRF15640.1 3-oxoacyl-ACP reductase [Nocardioides sp. Soil796]